MFRTLFKRSEETPQKAVGPLNLSVGRAVEIDFTSLLVAQDKAVELPRDGTFLISGYGIADLGGGSFVHRYYDDDNSMLQFLCEHGTDERSVREVTFFLPWDSHVPSDEVEWEEWVGPNSTIGAPVFEADNYVFDRLWDSHREGHVSPVAFSEKIVTNEEELEIYQKIMLYTRDLGDIGEYLIIAAEQLKTDSMVDGTIEFMIGYDLHVADVVAV